MKHVPFVLVNYNNIYNVSFHRASLYPQNNKEISIKYFLNRYNDILHTSWIGFNNEGSSNKYLITNNFNIYKTNINNYNIRFIPIFFKTHIAYKKDIIDIVEIDTNFCASLSKDWIINKDILFVCEDLERDVYLNISRHPDPFYSNYKKQHLEQEYAYKLYDNKNNKKTQATHLLKLHSPNLDIDTVWIVSMIDTPNINTNLYHVWLKKDIEIDSFMCNIAKLYGVNIEEYDNTKKMSYNTNNEQYIKNWDMYELSLKLMDRISIDYFKNCNDFQDVLLQLKDI